MTLFFLLYIIVVILIILTLLCILYYKWRDTHIKGLSGPTPLPFIGIIHKFADTKRVFERLSEYCYTYGANYRGYFLHELNIITIDPVFIEFALTNLHTINKGTIYDYLHNWLGTGLLTSTSSKWRQRRKMITPAYHFKVLDQFVEMFDRNGNIMIDRLKDQVGKDQTDIFSYVNLCALDTICETAMGIRMNVQLNVDSEFVQATKEMVRIIMERGFKLQKVFNATYIFTEDYKKEKKALKVLHGYTMNLIKSRREVLLKKCAETQCTDEFNSKPKDNFLDLLLKTTIAGESLTDEDIREEVDTFMFEGHDTVTSGISFALYLISNDADVQNRLMEEQRSIFDKDPNRPTTLNDLKEMKYLEMVIKESLRLFPSVPMIARTVSENLYYKDWYLMKGTQIVVYTRELHRNAEIYPEPEKFIPERFLPENQATRHPFAYIPFSAGHRNCIGQKFAMLEMQSTISKVIRNFKLLPLIPKHEPVFLPEVVLRSDNGVLLKLEKRAW